MISAPEKESRPGFKKTKLGWIPEDWEIDFVENYAVFKRGSGISKSEILNDGFQAVRYGELYTHYQESFVDTISFINESSAAKSKEIKNGDILLTCSGEDRYEIGKALAFLGDKTTFASGDLMILSAKGFDSKFLAAYLNSDKAIRQKIALAQGHSVVHIYPSQIKKVIVSIPPLPEQKAIANCLSTWDTSITKLDTLIKAKQQLKKALMQQLLSGKKRLPGFDGEWEEKKLGQYFEQSTAKVIEENSFEVLTSSRRGLVKQSDYYESGRLSSKSSIGFNVIKKNELTYRSRTDDGSFKFNLNLLDVDGCVSKYYPVFKSSGSILFFSYFLNYYNRKIGLYATGSSQLVLSFKELSKIRFKLPEQEEQTAIAQVLNTADQEIALLTTQRNQLQLQKKGLMQQLLTGKKRLKVCQ